MAYLKISAEKNGEWGFWTVTFYTSKSPDKPTLQDTRCVACNRVDECTGKAERCLNDTDFVVEGL